MKQTINLIGGVITLGLLLTGCSDEAPKDIAEKKEQFYTVFEKPEALTWMQRADKKRKAGQFDIALDYYDRALAVNVKNVSYAVALTLWNSGGGLPFDPAKVETIARSLPQPIQRNLLSTMGRGYLNGTPDHIPKNETEALRLLEAAKDMGNLDARLTLDNHKSGRNVPLLGETQFSDESFEVDLSGIDKDRSDKDRSDNE